MVDRVSPPGQWLEAIPAIAFDVARDGALTANVPASSGRFITVAYERARGLHAMTP